MPGLRHADAAARAAKPRQGAGGLALAETTATPGDTRPLSAIVSCVSFVRIHPFCSSNVNHCTV